MFSFKMRVALLAVLGAVLIASAANAAWMTPTSVVSSSLTLNYQYAANSADGSAGTYSKFGCDDGINGDLSNDICTGFVIYDLGSTQLVAGMQLTVRNANSSGMPKNLNFFSVSDADMATLIADGYTPDGPKTVAQLVATGYPVIGANVTLPYVNYGATDQVDLAAADQFTTRYVGLKFNTTYDLPTGKCNTIAEVKFNAIPEPSTIALLAAGLFGLLAYAWKKTHVGESTSER